MVVTFDPHTQSVVSKGDCSCVLTTRTEKEELFSSLGIDHLVFLRFNSRLRNMSPAIFMSSIIFKYLNPRGIVFGYDHKFGNKRAGDYALLKKMCLGRKVRVWKVSPYRLDHTIVSSTMIRKRIKHGDIRQAVRLLGGPYPLTSIVEQGNGYGRKLGYPTANLSISQEKCLFPEGVYYGSAWTGKRRYAAAISYGRRETAFAQGSPVFEAHLSGFSGNLYGKKLRVFVEGRIRNQVIFPSEAALVHRIEKDIAYIKTIKKEDFFGSHN